MNKHKHHDVIVAWAAGAEIEYLTTGGFWSAATSPIWDESRQYRIKPEPPAKSYPVTGMTGQDYAAALCCSIVMDAHKCERIANAALRHAIDSGQVAYPVVTVQYFGSMEEAVKRNAARDLAIAEAVREVCQESIFDRWTDDDFAKMNLAAIIATVKD